MKVVCDKVQSKPFRCPDPDPTRTGPAPLTATSSQRGFGTSRVAPVFPSQTTTWSLRSGLYDHGIENGRNDRLSASILVVGTTMSRRDLMIRSQSTNQNLICRPHGHGIENGIHHLSASVLRTQLTTTVVHVTHRMLTDRHQGHRLLQRIFAPYLAHSICTAVVPDNPRITLSDKGVMMSIAGNGRIAGMSMRTTCRSPPSRVPSRPSAL